MAFASGQEQAANGNTPASLVVTDAFKGQRFDSFCSCAVDPLCRAKILVMTQVRTDHEPGLGSIPEHLQGLAYEFGAGVTNHKRHDGEFTQDNLKKGQLHFDRVFIGVCFIHDRDLPTAK